MSRKLFLIPMALVLLIIGFFLLYESQKHIVSDENSYIEEQEVIVSKVSINTDLSKEIDTMGNEEGDTYKFGVIHGFPNVENITFIDITKMPKDKSLFPNPKEAKKVYLTNEEEIVLLESIINIEVDKVEGEEVVVISGSSPEYYISMTVENEKNYGYQIMIGEAYIFIEDISNNDSLQYSYQLNVEEYTKLMNKVIEICE